jgi:hypothetical protein
VGWPQPFQRVGQRLGRWSAQGRATAPDATQALASNSYGSAADHMQMPGCSTMHRATTRNVQRPRNGSKLACEPQLAGGGGSGRWKAVPYRALDALRQAALHRASACGMCVAPLGWAGVNRAPSLLGIHNSQSVLRHRAVPPPRQFRLAQGSPAPPRRAPLASAALTAAPALSGLSPGMLLLAAAGAVAAWAAWTLFRFSRCGPR